MNRIHDDERSRLKSEVVNDLMMISLNGPPVSDFDFNMAVMRWYTAAPRKERLSTGLVTQWKMGQAGQATAGAPTPMETRGA